MKKAVLAAMAIMSCIGLSTGALADTYSATAQGFGGEVSVSLTIEDGVLTDVSVDGPSETQGVGSNAVDQLPGKMLEAKNHGDRFTGSGQGTCPRGSCFTKS